MIYYLCDSDVVDVMDRLMFTFDSTPDGLMVGLGDGKSEDGGVQPMLSPTIVSSNL
jgi:hypothetical protein